MEGEGKTGEVEKNYVTEDLMAKVRQLRDQLEDDINGRVGEYNFQGFPAPAVRPFQKKKENARSVGWERNQKGS